MTNDGRPTCPTCNQPSNAAARAEAAERECNAMVAGIGILYCARIKGILAIAPDGSHDWFLFAEEARKWAEQLVAERDAALRDVEALRRELEGKDA